MFVCSQHLLQWAWRRLIVCIKYLSKGSSTVFTSPLVDPWLEKRSRAPNMTVPSLWVRIWNKMNLGDSAALGTCHQLPMHDGLVPVSFFGVNISVFMLSAGVNKKIVHDTVAEGNMASKLVFCASCDTWHFRLDSIIPDWRLLSSQLRLRTGLKGFSSEAGCIGGGRSVHLKNKSRSLRSGKWDTKSTEGHSSWSGKEWHYIIFVSADILISWFLPLWGLGGEPCQQQNGLNSLKLVLTSAFIYQASALMLAWEARASLHYLLSRKLL